MRAAIYKHYRDNGLIEYGIYKDGERLGTGKIFRLPDESIKPLGVKGKLEWIDSNYALAVKTFRERMQPYFEMARKLGKLMLLGSDLLDGMRRAAADEMRENRFLPDQLPTKNKDSFYNKL